MWAAYFPSPRSSFSVAHEIITVLVCKLEPDKAEPPASAIDLLGMHLAISLGGKTADRTTHHIGNLQYSVEACVAKDALRPGEAPNLQHRLTFSSSLLHLRFGRPLLAPVKQRQYLRKSRLYSLTPRLRTNLARCGATLSLLPSRPVRLAPFPPAVAEAGAIARNHLAVAG